MARLHLFLALVTLISMLGFGDSHYWLPASSDQPIVVSEMGFGVPADITENTEQAFRMGLSLGASGVEVTSRVTADGHVALLHNATVPGCYGGRRTCVVSKTNLVDLPPGTLELSDYFQIVSQYGMNIMMQNNKMEPGYDPSNSVAEVVVQRVLEAGLQDKVLLSAFDIGTIRHARAHCGGCGIRTAWLEISWKTKRAMGLPPILAPEKNSTQYLDEVREAGLDAFNPEALIVDRALMDQAAQRGIQLFVWWLGINSPSFETPDAMQLMANCGITGFITPRVTMGIDALRHKTPEQCNVTAPKLPLIKLPLSPTEFFFDPNVSYHNVATLGPVPRKVLEGAFEDVRELQGLTAERYFGAFTKKSDEVRARAGSLLGCDPNGTVLFASTTHALNAVAEGLLSSRYLKRGDAVMVTDNEHAGGVAGWEHAEAGLVVQRVGVRIPASASPVDLLWRRGSC